MFVDNFEPSDFSSQNIIKYIVYFWLKENMFIEKNLKYRERHNHENKNRTLSNYLEINY